MDPFLLGNWQVLPKLNQLKLRTSDREFTVTPKIMQLLVTLAEQKTKHGTDPLSIDELINKVWAERVVADSSVYQAVAQLRKVLSEDANTAVYIERISGQGYRIANEVKIELVKQQDKKPIPPFGLLSVALLLTGLFIFIIYYPDEEKITPFFEPLSLAAHLIEQTEMEQLEQAKQIYLDVLAQDSNNVEALHGLCDSYRLLAIYGTLTEVNRDKLCQPLLERAYDLAPNDSKVLASMARQAYELKDLKQAENLFEQSLAKNNNNASAWHWYGRLKRNQNQVNAALNAHQKAFRLAPNNPIVLRGLAYAYLNSRNLIEARKYYERSLMITPTFKNKPLYDLDFYPLDQSRAENYLAWFRKYEKDHLKKYPSHKLSYILFLLSINQGDKAQQAFNNIPATKIDDLPQHFKLYVEAALAWRYGQDQQTLELLLQRYQIAPEQNHFVMPYLVALLHNGQYEQALTLFLKHFSNTITEPINQQQLGQHLLLARLYKLTRQESNYQDTHAKILSYRQAKPEFPIQQELIWQDLTNEYSNRFELLTALLDKGWLPDYNDSLFLQRYYSSLLTEPAQMNTWKQQLETKQACVWQQTNGKLCP